MSRRSSSGIIITAALAILMICGCREPDSAPVPVGSPAVVVETDQKLSTAPHLFDVYRATNADNAVVFLHGAMGTKHYMAYQLGLVPSNVEGDYNGVNEQVILENKMIAVFPQGRAIAASPMSYTWSNYLMTSGQDDMQFIRDLLGYITAQYNVTRFYIAGHSNGGTMANRIWCEAPELFDGYVAVAGPPSVHFLARACSPPQVKPYLGIIGSDDNVYLISGHWEDRTWVINPLLLGNTAAFIDPVPAVIGERYFLPARVAAGCVETVRDGGADAVTQGPLTTWSFCGGSIKLLRIEGARHTLESLETASGSRMIDFVLNFISE